MIPGSPRRLRSPETVMRTALVNGFAFSSHALFPGVLRRWSTPPSAADQDLRGHGELLQRVKRRNGRRGRPRGGTGPDAGQRAPRTQGLALLCGALPGQRSRACFDGLLEVRGLRGVVVVGAETRTLDALVVDASRQAAVSIRMGMPLAEATIRSAISSPEGPGMSRSRTAMS